MSGKKMRLLAAALIALLVVGWTPAAHAQVDDAVEQVGDAAQSIVEQGIDAAVEVFVAVVQAVAQVGQDLLDDGVPDGVVCTIVKAVIPSTDCG